jgi:tRNA nucleotidyltransferase (CCA-adding enzyme)
MQIYMVGGAVRDALLGLPVKDRDWVVVGSTPDELVALGYLPVGRDFPVFLHPVTREEYALARTERKTAPGYRGFAIHSTPDVTLEQDLARRDLTINSIAVHADSIRADGTFDTKKATFIDPFDGLQDITHKVLRHTTLAFHEDPVRILRVARLAARFTDFSVAPETLQLMREMVQHGEADHLVSERVWQELSRGLLEELPSRMFDVLSQCDVLPRLFPEVLTLVAPFQTAVLNLAASRKAPLTVSFACLCACFELPEPSGGNIEWIKNLSERLRVPTGCRELAEVVARERAAIERCTEFDAVALVNLLERCDAIRKPERLKDILLACECLHRLSQPAPDKPYPQREQLLSALASVQTVATDLVAAHAISIGSTGPKIGQMVHAARVAAVDRELRP